MEITMKYPLNYFVINVINYNYTYNIVQFTLRVNVATYRIVYYISIYIYYIMYNK